MRLLLYVLSVLFILVGAGWLALPHFKNELRPYTVYSTDQLTQLVNTYQMENDALKKQIDGEAATFDNNIRRMIESGQLPAGGQAMEEPIALKDQRRKWAANIATSQKMWSELAIRRYHLREAAISLIVLGFLLPFLAMLLVKFDIGIKSDKKKINFLRLSDEQRYVSEYQFESKLEVGFVTEEKAIEWLRKDPFEICDYCGGKLNLPDAGHIQKVLFFREVPEGALDQQVVLGELYFTKSHERATCPSCGKLVERK
jgi:hypothetical protein